MAGFTVSTLTDELYDGGDLAAETADGGGLSLREALALANGDPTNHHLIEFAALLAGGTLTLTNGQLDIRSDVAIVNDHDPDLLIRIDAGGNSRVFWVTTGTDGGATSASIRGLYATGGSAYIGGGIWVDLAASLAVHDSVVARNAAEFGGGIFNGGSLTLVDSTVRENDAERLGGGLDNRGTAEAVNASLSAMRQATEADQGTEGEFPTSIF